ncbi:SRPBCC family protein [Paracoccus benzoatiresistens]|uniref:SRPBCC family protein n=1 Tax=Paracoccus benzoatiresistens TaxID=2997341 RepID=A0ABT4J1H9_9RHOB|nr:SRPBCC family protein [Paracoccus sp. EF6]MCZ0960981.1 SRPBCC family protein [Paracoccus sp. EF6]
MPRRQTDLPLAAVVLALSVGAGLAAGAIMKSSPKRPPDSAPGRTARRSSFGDYQIAGRTVTIKAPRSRIYEMWRNPDHLTDFMEGLAAVQVSGDDVTWVVDTPDGHLAVETRLVEQRENEALAWRSVEGAEIEIEAKVRLRDAPAGRGTEVEAHIAWIPQAGIVGQWAARLRGADPKIRGKQELKRLKMLLETGEIATSTNRKAD